MSQDNFPDISMARETRSDPSSCQLHLQQTQNTAQEGREGGGYVNSPASSDTERTPFEGGYFPPLIFEDFSNIVSSRTESFSSSPATLGTGVLATVCVTGSCDCRRLSASALVMSVSQAERQRVRVAVGRVDVDARVR